MSIALDASGAQRRADRDATRDAMATLRAENARLVRDLKRARRLISVLTLTRTEARAALAAEIERSKLAVRWGMAAARAEERRS